MGHQQETVSILGEEKRVVSQEFSGLLDALIRHVENGDFDPKVFNELYLQILSCASRIFELEKKSYSMAGMGALHQQLIPYGTFSTQLARLNEKCREQGIGQSHSMLAFLLDWFAGRFEERVNELDNRHTEMVFASAC